MGSRRQPPQQPLKVRPSRRQRPRLHKPLLSQKPRPQHRPRQLLQRLKHHRQFRSPHLDSQHPFRDLGCREPPARQPPQRGLAMAQPRRRGPVLVPPVAFLEHRGQPLGARVRRVRAITRSPHLREWANRARHAQAPMAAGPPQPGHRQPVLQCRAAVLGFRACRDLIQR
jgi:hypothetical protein